MQLSNAPLQIEVPFGEGDTSKTNPLPIPSQQGTTPGAASFTDGFPPLCAVDPSAGGVGPSKADMNGALFALSAIDNWASAGGTFKYNLPFATAVGGYPKGALLQQAAGVGLWFNTVDNNETDPDTGGAGWVPINAGAVIRMTSSVFASAQQTLAVGNSKVLFDTVEFDSAGLWDATHKRFVATVAGNYRISGYVSLNNPPAQGPFLGLVFKNGALTKQCYQNVQVSNTSMTVDYNVIVPCVIGDFIELFVSVPQTAVQAGTTGSNEKFVYAQLEYLGT